MCTVYTLWGVLKNSLVIFLKYFLIVSPDIFYQTFDTKGGGGKMICKLCDPSAFSNNKQ